MIELVKSLMAGNCEEYDDIQPRNEVEGVVCVCCMLVCVCACVRVCVIM